MNEIDQMTQTVDGGSSDAAIPLQDKPKDGEKCPACQQIGDQEIYILNPLYRLRNAKDHVLVHGVQDLGDTRVHRALGVTLALCNGSRTVTDIARITRPLVKIADDVEAAEVAKHEVKNIIYFMKRTKEERAGTPAVPTDLPAVPVLITKAAHDGKFGNTGIRGVDYRARDFLPKDASEIKHSGFRVKHETSPVELNWHFTSECSVNCRYCYLGRRKVTLLPKERILSLIDEAAAIGVLCINPLGGDVVIYPYFRDIFESMSKHKFLPALLSTKSFISKEKAKILADCRNILLALQISIDSTVDDVADYLVRRKHFCQRIFRSIANALEYELPVQAKAVVTPYNILTIPKLYRDLKRCGVKLIKLATYSRSGFHHTDDLFNDQKSFEWLEQQIEKLREEFPGDYIQLQNGAPAIAPFSREQRRAQWASRAYCNAGRTGMMICADGKVIPCEQMPETDEYFCGDVSHQSIQEVWDGARLRELTYGVPREKFRGQLCYDCEEREDCHEYKGICIRDLAIYYGNIYQLPINCPKANLPFVRRT